MHKPSLPSLKLFKLKLIHTNYESITKMWEIIPSKLERFKTGLEQYGLDFEEVKKWKYCGYYTATGYWERAFPNKPRPQLELDEHQCPCGQWLQNIPLITDSFDYDKARFLPIGECCLKAFVIKHSQTCMSCGEFHKSRLDNFCKSCRTKETKKEVKTVLKKTPKENECNDCRKKCGGYQRCYQCYKKYAMKDGRSFMNKYI